jgi:tight adherence protein C
MSASFLGPDLLAADLAIPGLAAAAALVATLAASRLFRAPSRAARLARSAGRRGPGRRRAERAPLGRGVWRAVSGLGALKGALDGRVRERLDQAGFRTTDAAQAWLAAKVLMPLAFAGAAVAWLALLAPAGLPLNVQGIVVLLAAIAGMLAPDLYVANAAQKRRATLQKAVPDALDLLVICAEAGSSLDAAISRVARELGTGHPLLAEELTATSFELGFLPDRRSALDNLARRTGLPAIRSVVATLHQAEKYGTPLAQSLRVLSAEYRNERMMRAEEKAARLPAILTVPLIVFVMPTLFVVLLGPAALQTIDNFTK